jgi:glycosyltransferase involved in cell wall biosynthesis
MGPNLHYNARGRDRLQYGMSKTQPLRILYLIDFWASPGGTERHLSYLTTHLDRQRFLPFVVIFNYQPNALVDKAKAAGVEVVHIPVARYYTPNALLQGIRLFRFMRKRDIDLVQTFHYKSDIYGAVVARLAGVRHIVSSKRDAADYKGAFRFFMHKLVRPITQRYIAVSEVVATVIRNKEKVAPEKISVIHNGVDLVNYSVPDTQQKAHLKASLGFAPDDFVIGMSAWFRPEKDHQLLLDAFVELSEFAPHARLVFIGNGPLFDHYRQWIADRKLEERIRLVGAVDDVRPYLGALDVACLVPRMNEGFSNSVLEKMATGVPVIVTDIGGNKEAVADGESGFVIAPGDQRALLTHLRTLHDDGALRLRMARESRQRVERLFSLQSMVQRHADLYLSMTTASGRV